MKRALLILLCLTGALHAGDPIIPSVPDTSTAAPPSTASAGDLNARMSKGDGTQASEIYRIKRVPSTLTGWDAAGTWSGIPFSTFDLAGAATTAVAAEANRAQTVEASKASAADLNAETARAKAAEAAATTTTLGTVKQATTLTTSPGMQVTGATGGTAATVLVNVPAVVTAAPINNNLATLQAQGNATQAQLAELIANLKTAGVLKP